MKPVMKLGSLFLAVLMIFTAVASGCSLNKEFSYKTSDEELPIGVYIYCLYNAYTQAKGYAEKLDGYSGASDSWLEMEITDDDGNKAVASKWIKDKAQDNCLKMLAVNADLKRLGATADESIIDAYANQAETYWYQYGLQSELEEKGVSLESFKYANSNAVAAQAALFDALYMEGGEQEVKQEEIVKYFEENYVKYAYLPVNLYESTTDEAGEQKDVAFSADKVKAITEALDADAKTVSGEKDAAKAAETSEKLVSEFIAANGLDESAVVTNIAVRNETNVGEEVDKIIAELGEGKAKTVKVGDGDTAMYYYVFRYGTQAAKDEYLADGTNDASIVSEMKQDDFKKYTDDLVKNLKYEKSGAVDGYDPKMFFVKEEETTAASAEE